MRKCRWMLNAGPKLKALCQSQPSFWLHHKYWKGDFSDYEFLYMVRYVMMPELSLAPAIIQLWGI